MNKKKGVIWFLFGNKDCASSRIHGHLINESLRNIGYNSEIVYSPLTLVSNSGDLTPFEETIPLPTFKELVCVVQKLRGTNIDRLVSKLKKLGAVIFYINCDLEYTNNTVHSADVILTVTDELKIWHLSQQCKKVIVVKEPYEYSNSPENKFFSNNCIRALWFGYSHNIDPLLSWKCIIDRFFKNKVDLVICSDHSDSDYLWSYQNQKKLLMECDIALLPSSESYIHSMKSANRLIQSMACSLPSIVGCRPSYHKVAAESGCVLIADSEESFVEKINYLLDSKNRKNVAYKSYNYVKDRFSSHEVAKEWANAFNIEHQTLTNYIYFNACVSAIKTFLKIGVCIKKIINKV